MLDSHASGHTPSGGDAVCAGMTIFAWSISIMPPTETCSEFLEIPLRGYDNLLFVSTVIPTINPYV